MPALGGRGEQGSRAGRQGLGEPQYLHGGGGGRESMGNASPRREGQQSLGEE